MKIRWKRWVAATAGLLAAYTVLGFWLVPLAFRHQIPSLGQSELARQATIGKVSFNPYTLRLEAADLQLAEADGAPLFSIGRLAVQLQWRSLVRRAWSFSEIRIIAPSANLVVAPDGKFNLAELLATLERPPNEAPADTGLPRLAIERFALEQGKVDVLDRRAGYANLVSPIDFVLTNFSTLPDQGDAYTLSAQSARGGKLRWKGNASVNPVRATGELNLENASLPELAVYLKSYTRATVAAGQLSATLPYVFSYANGKFEASLAGARVQLRDLALARESGTDSFAALKRLDVSDINADLIRREATVGEMRAGGGKLSVKRDAKGQLDLASLMLEATEAATPSPAPAVVMNNWRLAVKQVVFDQVAISAVDETASPPLKVSADKVRLQLQLAAAQTNADLQLTMASCEFSLADLVLSSGAQTRFKLAQLGFTEGAFDLASRRASIGRLYAEGGQLQFTRDRKGKLNVMDLLPALVLPGSPAAPSSGSDGPPWIALVKSVELSKFGAQVLDQGSGVKVHVTDLAMKLEGASSDFKQPVKFNAGLNLREGGHLSAQGSLVPASGALQADVQLKQFALAPFQPLLGQHLKLKIAGGSVSARGHLTTGAATAKNPGVRYAGRLNIAALVLKEADGDLFASWKNAGADKLTASLSPNLLDIAELRVVEPNAKLIIENDRSFNAARLLVRPADSGAKAKAASATSPATADNPFPVRIRRVRVQNAKLDFTDLSLRPQFAAKIYELNGVVNGLSSNRESRSQIELDGRVDEFGLARIRGELNPFKPNNNTDINVVFRNVDMVPASPYSMKFAGYRIAEGKISLDLQYKVRDSKLEGDNKIVIDNLTLGEKVESPDALKLPLQLAIAILKDRNGRIDLGLPVSGDLSDPQVSYGAIIWKAIGNLLTRIVTAPFRALGRLLGVSGEKLEAIEFDPGSHRLLPPEREKVKQVAQLLAQRGQLKLAVPGQYSEAADGAALRAHAVRIEIARRAGIKLEPGEEPGPVDLGERAVRGALRQLYAERFGDAELDQQKESAEGAAAATGAAASTPDYNKLRERLDQNQPLPADALTRLGAQRAEAILAALKEAGVDSARAVATAPEKVVSDAGKPVPLKLGLAPASEPG